MATDFALTRALLDEAGRERTNLSQKLEQLDPTSKYPAHEQNIDAFTRQLIRLDIRTASDPISGMPAHTWERFYESDKDGSRDERSLLASEFLNRTYRKAAAIRPINGFGNGAFNKDGRFSAIDGGVRVPFDPVTTYDLYPPAIAPGIRAAQIQPSMLNYLVAMTRVINSEASYALYLTDNVQAFADARMPRVEEYGEVPAMRVQTSEVPTRVKKYGRRVDMSYEQMRRMSIDMVSFYVNYIAAVAAREKEDQAIDVLVNGDGNSGTSATSTNGSTLDSGAAGVLTLKMWWRFRMKQFTRPYNANVAIGTEAAIAAILLLSAGSANIAASSYAAGSNSGANNYIVPRSSLDGMVLIDNSTVASNTILTIDNRWALEMLLEAGSDIVETDKIINAQYTSIVITENIGFDILLKQKVGSNNQTMAQILAYTA